ncbi:MAG TPA: PHP domain-containing protein [Lachnospiraceae bacterium]|nr:PHP domain-containing protein [Lachnospiraceae bacterium]
MKIVDLHVHSTISDGTMSPADLVDYAIEKGLKAFALTDHDTIDGILPATNAAKGKDIEVIPGIELSSEYHGKDIHILGLYIDYHSDVFLSHLRAFQNSRDVRNEKMCQKLQTAGIDITYEKLQTAFPHAVITRAHYAKFMLDNGYIKSMSEAFDKYIGDYSPYYIPREKVTPFEAIKVILEAGGIPILAHPILYHMSTPVLEELVSLLKEKGLMGIEAVYSTYSTSEERDMKRLAIKYQLCISGGSDFHGSNKPKIDLAYGYGKLFIPETILTDLINRRPYGN